MEDKFNGENLAKGIQWHSKTDGVTDGVKGTSKENYGIFLEVPVEGVTATLASMEYVVKDWKLKKVVWWNPSAEEKDMKLGDRVWPASEPRNAYFQLKEIKEVGSVGFPQGGYICATISGVKRAFDLDGIIKHPGKQDEPELKKYKKKKK